MAGGGFAGNCCAGGAGKAVKGGSLNFDFYMKRFILLVLLVAPFFVCAQDSLAVVAGPQSKIELFLEKSVFYKKEYFQIGRVDRILVEGLVVTDLITKKESKGVYIVNTLSNRSNFVSTNARHGFLDLDEISDVTKAISYLNEEVMSTPADGTGTDIEYKVLTRGGIVISMFNLRGKWQGQIELKKYVLDRWFALSPLELITFMDLLNAAVKKME